MATEGRQFLDHLKAVADPEDLPMLLVACAGQRVYVPRNKPSPDNWITRAVGEAKAEELVKKLNGDGYYDFMVDVPMNGGGIIAAVHQMIERKVVDGLRVGKSVRQIAADCGITARAVQLQKVRLAKRGQLPTVDETAAAANRYFGKQGRPITHNIVVVEHRSEGLGGNMRAAVEDARTVREDDEADAGDRVGRIFALIERTHGRAACARIREACRGRSVSLRPEAVGRPTHPFRSALDDTDSRLLAIKIEAAGLSEGRVELPDPGRAEVEARSAAIRDRLLQGLTPESVADELGLDVAQVKRHHRKLRDDGLVAPLPDRRGRATRTPGRAGRGYGSRRQGGTAAEAR